MNLLSILVFCLQVMGRDFNYYSSNEIDPADYLYGSKDKEGDPIFNTTQSINLDVDIGITSDCGKMSLKNTLNASLNNILNAKKYFDGIGEAIPKVAPMLILCYTSPTWCAILKHAQLKANFLAELRLNQCNAINRFVDSRVSEYYQERSTCVQNEIKAHSGNLEGAMESCSNSTEMDIKDWSGKNGKSKINKLIESTAKWANMNTDRGKKVLNLTKALVGDTIIKEGKISVDYGPRKFQITPLNYLSEVKQKTHQSLCQELIPKLLKLGGNRANIYKILSKDDLAKINGSSKSNIDHQTVLSLLHFPYNKRKMACKKLANAISVGVYSTDMGQSLDFLSSTVASNPHLPVERKKEAEVKRNALKDQIEMTFALEKQNNEPLNNVLQQINSEGRNYLKLSTKNEVQNNQNTLTNEKMESIFFDGADRL